MLPDWKWLTSDEGEPWIRFAEESGPNSVQTVTTLRKKLPASRARLVCEQAALRHKARIKFPSQTDMFYTPVVLEQSTDEVVARYKARRFAGFESVADLCCGIGGDLLALREQAPVWGIEKDRSVAWFAAMNCRRAEAQRLGYPARVCVADASVWPVDRVAAWHVDPDRRASGRKSLQLTAAQPSGHDIDRMLAENPHGAIKLAPASGIPPEWTAHAELEWISHRRECRQLVAWFGKLAKHPGQRLATKCVSDGDFASFSGTPGKNHRITPQVGKFVYEPDPAILAAGLAGALADELDLSFLREGGSYLTSHRQVKHPIISGFRVLEVFAWNRRRLKSYLEQHQLDVREVKQRATSVEPQDWLKELRRGEGTPVSLIVTRVHDGRVVLVCQRLEGSEFSQETTSS